MNKAELLKKRAAAFDEMKKINDAAKADNRNHLNEDESKRYAELDKEYEDAGIEIRELDTRDAETKIRVENLEKREKEMKTTPKPVTVEDGDPNIGMPKKDVRAYSLMKAIRAAAKNDWTGAELEREASDAVADNMGTTPQGFYMPYDVLSEKRDLNVGTDSAGGYLVDDELKVGSFIDLLRNKMVVSQLGATVMSGLKGNIDIPKKTGQATSYWLAEGGEPTESQATLGQVALAPKTVAAYTELTRRFQMQSSVDAENFVRADLAQSLALAMDLAAINGSGVSNQPEGIINVTGIGSVAIGTNGGAITWAKIVDLETEVAIDNADIGNLKYLTNTRVRGRCKQIEKASSTGMFLWDSGNMLNGYSAAVTNQVPNTLTKGTSDVCSAMIFGNWADLLIGTWGSLDILVDPYSMSKSGGMRVTAFQDCDIQVRHAESFAAILDITTA